MDYRELFDRISIPCGTIRRNTSFAISSRFVRFQFLVVRLEVAFSNVSARESSFQFLVVRLEAARELHHLHAVAISSISSSNSGACGFQFLVVRLEAMNLRTN